MKPERVVLATGNPGKIRELRQLLEGVGIEALPQAHFNIEGAEETGLSFVENSIQKARHVASLTGLPAIADDSGLAVDALGGAPGIYSARYAGAGASDAENLDKLLLDLQGIADEQRGARFVAVIVYLASATDPLPRIYQGIWEGRILTEAHGKNGFGYDPVFFVPDQGVASAELSPAAKNAISHRGLAMRGLRAWLAN